MGMNFTLINQYVNNITIVDDLLEIGSDNNEGSTGVLSSIAAQNRKILHSVDINDELINHNINKYRDTPIKFYVSTGEDFLDHHSDLRFSVVLLDNFDWDWWPENPEKNTKHFEDQKNRYKTKFNLEMTNNHSQIAHLTQAIKLTNMLSQECVVVCDDTFMGRNQTYDGKCGAAVPYLMSLGFQPYEEKAGIILIRK